MFSGIGGFDLALQNLGHEIIGACEIDKYARSIYERHFPDVPIHEDATKLNPEELPDIDGICAGFPCQAFSIAGKRRGFDDTRGSLFFEIARIAKEKRPRYLLLENVKGLLSHDKGETFRTILNTLDEIGYDAEWQVLNSKYFVPQNRERVFIVGHLRGENTRQVFPLGEVDSISDKTKEGEQGKEERIRSQDCSSTIDARYGALRNSGETYMIYLSQTNSNMKQRIQQRDSSWTLTNNCSDFGLMVDDKIRKFTPTECERLQGFPDGWTEEISDTQRYKCIGNAVTVPVVQYIAEHLT